MLHGEYLYNYDKIRVSRSEIAAQKEGFISSEHFFSLVYVANGDVMLSEGQKRCFIKSNSLILIKRNTVIPITAMDKDVEIKMIDFKKKLFLGEENSIPEKENEILYLLKNTVGFIKTKEGFSPDFLCYHDESDFTGRLIAEIYEEYKKRQIKHQEVLRSYITVLLVRIFRTLHDDDNVVNMGDLVQRIVDYTELHYMEKLTVADLAMMFNYSESYVEKKFKLVIGYTYPEFLRQKRIFAAYSMLTSNDITVNEVAKRVGYSDEKSFTKMFKRYIGIPPTQMRQKYNQKSKWYYDMPDLREQKERK